MDILNPDDCFCKLDIECKILDIIENHIPKSEWIWVPWQHICTNLPRLELFGKDPFIDSMIEEGGRLSLYKIPGATCYNWHKDTNIGTSLNMVLDEYLCQTIFSVGHYPYLTGFGTPILDKITELKYEPRKWFLFNSQVRHKVVNLDTRDRYLLTIIFDKSRSYQELRNIIFNTPNS